MSKWSEIPIDIAIKIAEDIEYYEDLQSFGHVCRWWRYARMKVNCITPSRHTPLLLLAEPPKTSKRQLYNLCSGKIKHVELPEPPYGSKRQLFKILYDGTSTTTIHYIDLPEYDDYDINGDWRYFASRGWLISVTQFGLDVTLVNPFSKEVIRTPPLPKEPCVVDDLWEDWHWLEIFNRFALSECPSKAAFEDFTIATIFHMDRSVAVWRSGDDHWIIYNDGYVFIDVNFCKGELYALDQHGRILALGDEAVSPTVRVVSDQLHWEGVDPSNSSYLMESDGKLLVVYREVDFDDVDYKTLYFKVWEVDVDSWDVKEVKSLGNKALFLGFNSSFSITASLANGCKPNCIYYADDNFDCYLHFPRRGGSDMGVYDLASGTKIEDYYNGPSRFSSDTSPPLWFEPCCCLP